MEIMHFCYLRNFNGRRIKYFPNYRYSGMSIGALIDSRLLVDWDNRVCNFKTK